MSIAPVASFVGSVQSVAQKLLRVVQSHITHLGKCHQKYVVKNELFNIIKSAILAENLSKFSGKLKQLLIIFKISFPIKNMCSKGSKRTT